VRRVFATVLMVCAVGAVPAYGQDRGDPQRTSSGSGRSRIYKLEELAWPQIDALNRQRTLFILPVGMLEEHGPHLPVGADTMGVMHEAAGASRRVSEALPEWAIVMMPALNYGSTGANVIGRHLVKQVLLVLEVPEKGRLQVQLPGNCPQAQPVKGRRRSTLSAPRQ
jgi:Creatinine amidohydrolase